MPVYEDKNGQRIETDREFNEAELDEAFGVKPATPQQAGANALSIAEQTMSGAGPAIVAPKAPVTGEEKAQAYYDYLKKGIDLSTRPGAAQTMATEEKKVRGEADAQKGAIIGQMDKYNIKTDHLQGAFGNEALDRASDIAPVATKAVIGLVESIVGLGNITSMGYAGYAAQMAGLRFKDAKQDLEYFLSPQQQYINQEIGKVQDFSERIKYGIRNPSYILQSVAESIPTMLAGGAIGRMVVKALPALAPYIVVGKQTATAIGAGVGEGAVTAGQMAEEVRQGSESGTLTMKQVGYTSLAGLVTGVIGAVGGKVAQRLGIDDLDILLVGGSVRAAGITDAQKAAKKSVLSRVFGSMIEEGIIEEMPQSAQEKINQNLAEGKPWSQGVGAAAADGLLSGLVMAPMAVGYHHMLDKNDRIAADLQKKIEDVINKPAPPPGSDFTATETVATEPEVQKSAPVVQTLEDGRTVALQDGVEIGSHVVGGTPILSEDIHGEERADILRQMMVNEPQAQGNATPDASQKADATVTPQTQENVVTGLYETIKAFVGKVLSTTGNKKDSVSLGTISGENSQRIKESTNLDVSEYERIIDNYSVRHILRNHGNEVREASRGQIAVTQDDIARIPEIAEQADRVSIKGKTKQGRDVIGYEKRINGFIYYMEEVRTGQKQLVPVTLYKKRAGTSNVPLSDDSKSLSQTSETLPDSDKSISGEEEPVKTSLAEQAKAINDKIGEKGSIDLTPIVELGRSIYQSGVNTFEKFSARIQELLGDVWEKVKGYVQQAWDIVSNERGSIDFGKKDDKIKDAVSRTEGTTGTTTEEARVSTSGSLESSNQKELSTAYNQAEAATAAQSELKQSPTFEEFERAVLGDANFGDTSMEDPLTRGMSLDELKAYQKTLAGNPQINKLEGAIQSLRTAQRELTQKIRAANKEEVKGLKEQMRELRAIGNDLFKAGQRFARTDAKVTEQRMQEEINGYKAMIPQARTLANEFFKAGQRMGAFDALQKMRQSMEMLKLRTAQLKQYRKLRDFVVTVAKSIDKKKTIDPEYRKAIKAALTWGAGDLEAFVANNFAKDDPSIIPQEQIDLLREAGENDLYERKPTFEDLDNQVSIIKQLMYQGRKLREIKIANERFEFKAAIQDMVTNIRSIWNVPALDKKDVLRAENYKDTEKDKKGILKKMLDVTNSMLSVLRKGEYIIKNLVAYDSSSPFYQATFGRMIESERTHLWLSRQVEPMINKAALLIREEFQSGEWDSDVTVTDSNGESETFTRSRMIGIALNSGCNDNINAMLSGNDFSKEMIQAVNDALTPAEKQFVNAVWDIFKWQLPHLQKAYKSMTGEDMVLVKGIYYPMFFDTNLSGRIADAQANQNLMQLYGSVTSINKGRTITRKGGLEALDLNPMKFLQAVDQTNKFIAYGESVRDVNRILSDMTVKSAIRDAIGDQYNRRLKDWLKRIANPIDDSKGSLEGIDKVMGFMRDRAQVAILGCALSTALMQPMAITMTVNRLGFANTMKGFLDFYSDWSAVKEFCLSSSGWLQMRVDETGDITIAEMMRKGDIFADPKSMKEVYNKALFAMIKLFDSLVTIPTWYSAYQVEMEKSGNHQAAVNYADEITRNSQGSSAAKDLAEVQGGNNTRKAFAMFYSFFSQQYNELVRSVDEVKHGKIGMKDLMISYMWVIAVPAILQAIIKSRGWLDEEKDPKKKGKRVLADLAKEFAGNAAASIPLMGSFVNALTSGFDFRPTAVTGLIDSGQKMYKGLTSSRGFWGKNNGEMPTWMREGGMALGYLARLPSRQMMRLAEEVWKVAARPQKASWRNAYNLIYKEPDKKHHK
jgi:hypothetical protein